MNSQGFIPTLVLTQNFLPAKGGTITWLLNTYGRYQTREAIIVTGQCVGGEDIDRTLPFRVERIPMQFAGWDPTKPAALQGYIKVILQVYRLSSQYEIRQIHVVRVIPEGLVALCVKWLNRVPYLLYAHGEEIKTGLMSRKFSWLMPKIYNGAATIIANSRNTKRLLLEIGVHKDKIHIIHPGVDAEWFRAEGKAGLAIRRRHGLGICPVLLTVGRLQRRKGQDMVIKALPRIQKNFPSVKYVIVGIGDEEAYLRRLTYEVGVSDSVIFAGQVPDIEMAAYYAACDLFVMPNRQIDEDIEGFGIAYLEAAAMSKPAIGGKNGGAVEAILDGVTGLRVDGDQIEDIAAAVILLLSDSEKARMMGENGRRRVEEEFSWEKILFKTRLLAAAIHAR